MNLYILSEIARLFKTYKKINYIGRIDDNLIKLHLDNDVFFINLEKSKSSIFCFDEGIVGSKQYKAPFDFALQKYCLKSNIIDCGIDGNNRILRLKLHKKLDYKEIFCTLQLEFTGKYTNAIILDSSDIILESLRKISNNKRIIKNGINLFPLPQQENFMMKKIDFGGDMIKYLHSCYKKILDENLQSYKIHNIASLENKKNKLMQLLNNLPSKDELIKKSKYYAHIGTILQNNMNLDFNKKPILLRDYDGNEIVLNLCDFTSKNASSLLNECFTKSKKLNLKSKNIILQEENLKDNINFLDSKINFVKNAKNISDIKIINPKNTKNNVTKLQYESFFVEGIKISIGKNKAQNIALLKDARANDIWMHLRNIPSSHLIIHCSKNHIKEEILNKACEILVSFCSVKNGIFEVDYTKRKFVKIKEGANVLYSNYSTITIKKDL